MMPADNAKTQKDRIRERYKGVDPDMLEVIPARKQSDFYDDEPKRVAIYVRVSTDDPRQTTSFEIQKNYYDDMVKRNHNWTLIDLYADEGISGTSLLHRDAFNRMIADSKAGKIDLIITKSVSRFSRNIIDCIGLVRELSELRPPVGVFFETEHIFTLKDDSEMGLNFQATMAQEESHIKSRIMNTSLEMRFSHGIVLTPTLLGYDHDDDGNLIINEEEAQTVRLIFFLYLYGYSCSKIAETLTLLGCKTKKGNTVWSGGSVLKILRNERHCGEVLTRKTYTPNYLNHKARKNMGDRNQHRVYDHHEAIVSRDDFIAVQKLINNAKYGNNSILPELRVMTEGLLQGFVSVNPRWAAFQANDYREASASAYCAEQSSCERMEIKPQNGCFDFRGFEVARSQFFNVAHKQAVTFYPDHIVFGMECIRKFDNCLYVELLIHPAKRRIAVRPSMEKARNAVQWAKQLNGIVSPRNIGGAAFLGTLYALADWKMEYRYRMPGTHRQKGFESVLLFDMSETEVFIPDTAIKDKKRSGACELDMEANDALTVDPYNRIIAYPPSWGNGFGTDFYQNLTDHALTDMEDWKTDADGTRYPAQSSLQVTSPEAVRQHIKDIISEIRQDADANG